MKSHDLTHLNKYHVSTGVFRLFDPSVDSFLVFLFENQVPGLVDTAIQAAGSWERFLEDEQKIWCWLLYG